MNKEPLTLELVVSVKSFVIGELGRVIASHTILLPDTFTGALDPIERFILPIFLALYLDPFYISSIELGHPNHLLTLILLYLLMTVSAMSLHNYLINILFLKFGQIKQIF